MLAVVRIFQRVLWDAIVELAGDDEEGRAAALILARPLIDYIDVLSDTLNKAYLEAGVTSHASKVRSELMELLLSGTPPAPGAPLNAARAAGLEHPVQLLVLVARGSSPAIGQPTLRIAANELARAAASAIEPLAVVRDDEVVVILPTRTGETHDIAARLQDTQRRLLERGIALAIGASTVHEGLDDIPAAYADACLALEQVRESGGVLALSGLGVLDYLILRAGDRRAWRLVPAAVRGFVENDARQGSVLSDTLLAYVACDLSVKLAAEQLFVHPNTAHYRLAKIEARTGCDVRNLRDVQLLTIAIRIRRGSHAV
jgi:sugar diacid utilization regulator